MTRLPVSADSGGSLAFSRGPSPCSLRPQTRRAGKVNYYNPDIYHGHHFDVEAAFWKQDSHHYQSEFRFALDTQTEGADPLTLEIGDIRNIALVFRTSELNNKFLGI